MSIAGNINDVKSMIAKTAADYPEFSAPSVKLIAVTKTLGIDPIREAVESGQLDLGENRVQEILEKYPVFPKDVRWHLIGHLQTNKVKYIVDKVHMIHSLDSLKLAEEIEKRAAAIDRVIPCLVQVNIADEDTKFGLRKEDTIDFLKEMVRFPHISVEGLMTIGPHVSDEEQIRAVFRELRLLKEEINALALPAVKMRELSMGMSSDYPAAVREGATMVRVGTTIFGARSVK
ncbi:MAG: YggS family pyridoxal phosphate-dependent enzyme [Firmicutes bacterium]|nr:YggS family pyridoxal phosphate-dependent enzyme [Bacillota bacterium]